MGKVTELIPADRRNLVAGLESFLDQVERGEVEAIAIVAQLADGTVATVLLGDEEKVDVMRVNYGLDCVKHRLLSHQLSSNEE